MTAMLSQRLRQAAEQHRAADPGADLTLSLQDLLRLHVESSLAVLLMLLAVVSVLPVAGAGTVMSVGIWVVAWSWVHARETLSLPHRLGQLALNERWSGRCLHGLAWLYESSQRCMRPRWAWLSHAATRIWWGGWIGLMGLVIFVPLPLGNVLPSLSLVLLSLGWMFRDGLALVLSAATGLAGVAYGLSMAHLAWVWITPYLDLSRAVGWLQNWL
jgi:hypothetical protein